MVVVEMSAWPSNIWTARRSAPWFSRCVAQAWRKVWVQHGAVAQAQGRLLVRCVQQGLDLRLRERLGNPQRLPRRGQAQRRVGRDQAFAQGPAEVALEDREAAVGRGRLGLRMAGGEIAV